MFYEETTDRFTIGRDMGYGIMSSINVDSNRDMLGSKTELIIKMIVMLHINQIKYIQKNTNLNNKINDQFIDYHLNKAI